MMGPLENITSCTSMGWVFLSPCPVNRYSQLRRAKNRAPTKSCPRARALGWWACVRTWRKTTGGIVFWCFIGGSVWRYPFNCRQMCKWGFPGVSAVGSG